MKTFAKIAYVYNFCKGPVYICLYYVCIYVGDVKKKPGIKNKLTKLRL